MLSGSILLRELCAPSADSSMGRAGMEDSESLFTHPRNEKSVAAKYLGRQLLGIQLALENGALGDVFWLPGPENPADGVTKVQNDMAPLLRLLQSGSLCPGPLRPLRQVALKENGSG